MRSPRAVTAFLLVAFLLPIIGSGTSGAAAAGTRGSDARVRGLQAPTSPFPGSDPRAVRAQASGCTPPAKLGVVFLVDNSLSMGWNDPSQLRGSAVELGLQELGAAGAATAVGFAGTPATIFAPVDLATGPVPTGDQIRAGLTLKSATAYTPAFAAAKAALAGFPATVDQRIVVLLSDGEPTDTFDVEASVGGLGARVYPIGFGDADNALLDQIATRSGGVNQAVGDGAATQGAIGRAIASARCQPVDIPETFELGPGQTRVVPFTVQNNTASFSALVTWAGQNGIDVHLTRPDGSTMGPGSLAPTETLTPTPSSVRAEAKTPPPGEWSISITSSRANQSSIKVSVDLLGGATQQHPLEKEPQPLRPGCLTSYTLGGQVAWSPCFEAIKGGMRSTVPIRLAGIDFAPDAGKSIDLIATGLTTGKLVSGGARMSVYARTPIVSGSVTLNHGPLSFDVGGPGVHLKFSGEVGKEGKHVAGLPIAKEPGLQLEWSATGAKITLSLDVSSKIEILTPPRGVDQKTGTETLKRGWGVEASISTSNERGIAVDSVHGQIDKAQVFGRLALENLFVDYSAADNILTGGGQVKLFDGPLAKHGLPSIKASLGLSVEPLAFAKFEAEVSDINKPVGPYVYLQKLGGSIADGSYKQPPTPWKVEGTTELTLGPKIKVPLLGEQSAVALTGKASYEYPATIGASADVKILNQQVSSATFTANLLTPEATLDGDVSLVLLGTGLEGRMSGAFKGSQFQLTGSTRLKVFGKNVDGGDAFINNNGWGGCRRGWGPDFGFRWPWSNATPKLMATSCDFGGLLTTATRSQAAGPVSAVVRKNTRGLLLKVTGNGGQPLGIVRGPDGTAVEVGTDRGYVETPKAAAVPDEGSNTVWVVLNAPAAGAWVVEPRAGSAPLALAGQAKAKPKARISTKLRRSGGRYRLTYRVRRVAGERLVVVERGPSGLAHTLLRTSRRSGEVRFSAIEGPAGARTLEATIEGSNGIRARQSAGSYAALKDVRPRGVRKLTVRRRGASATIRWAAPQGARPVRYRVTVRLRDGRTIQQSVSRRQLRLTGLARRTAGRVQVSAIGRSGLASRGSQTTLRRR